jgi:hypothetical protein
MERIAKVVLLTVAVLADTYVPAALVYHTHPRLRVFATLFMVDALTAYPYALAFVQAADTMVLL